MNEFQAGLQGFVDQLIKLSSIFILPDWNDVIRHMLPAAIVLMVLGPIITLLVLYWLYQWLHMPRFRVRPAELGPVPVPRDEAGLPLVPAVGAVLLLRWPAVSRPRDALQRVSPGADGALPDR